MLWGISWLNVQLMLADAARIDDLDINGNGDGDVVTKELKTAEDIEKFINAMM